MTCATEQGPAAAKCYGGACRPRGLMSTCSGSLVSAEPTPGIHSGLPELAGRTPGTVLGLSCHFWLRGMGSQERISPAVAATGLSLGKGVR